MSSAVKLRSDALVSAEVQAFLSDTGDAVGCDDVIFTGGGQDETIKTRFSPGLGLS